MLCSRARSLLALLRHGINVRALCQKATVSSMPMLMLMLMLMLIVVGIADVCRQWSMARCRVMTDNLIIRLVSTLWRRKKGTVGPAGLAFLVVLFGVTISSRIFTILFISCLLEAQSRITNVGHSARTMPIQPTVVIYASQSHRSAVNVTTIVGVLSHRSLQFYWPKYWPS